jgi:hypothetical protein
LLHGLLSSHFKVVCQTGKLFFVGKTAWTGVISTSTSTPAGRACFFTINGMDQEAWKQNPTNTITTFHGSAIMRGIPQAMKDMITHFVIHLAFELRNFHRVGTVIFLSSTLIGISNLSVDQFGKESFLRKELCTYNRHISYEYGAAIP